MSLGDKWTHTFSLVCDDCKVIYGCGHRQHLWNADRAGEFLFEHYGHTLRYLNNDAEDKRAPTYGAWRHGVH